MKFFLLTTWIALTVALSAAPKFAVVRVADIYRSLPSTAAANQALQEKRQAVLQGKRVEQFQALALEVRALGEQLKETRDQLDSVSGKALIREYELKQGELRNLQAEFEEYRAEENKEIDKEMVLVMRDGLNRVTKAVEQVAKEYNLDGVFDIPGSSNTGVPVLLYMEDLPDLSDAVIELLGEKPITNDADDESATGEVVESEESSEVEVEEASEVEVEEVSEVEAEQSEVQEQAD